jgi:hypothetical protein
MLSEILDGVIEFQERIPTLPPASLAAAKTDERRISDIERYLAGSEFQPKAANAANELIANRPKIISSIAASAPSLTSILSAPPLSSVRLSAPSNLANSSNPVRSIPTTQVNLVPRINELLEQVPPNVSIPDTPDLDSLILLQERRRRMSSGGSGSERGKWNNGTYFVDFILKYINFISSVK